MVAEPQINEMPADTPPALPAPEAESESSSRWTLRNVVVLAGGGVIGVIVLLFLIALLIVLFGDPEWWAIRMQYFRDLALIFLTLQGILIVTGIAVLVLQVARFVNLLRSEVKPITDDAQSAVREVRATSAFVSKNAVQPVIRFQAFFAGVATFVSELLQLKRLARRRTKGDS